MSYENVGILLVEDNPGDAMIIREMLKDTAYSTASFHAAGSMYEAQRAPIDRASVAMVLVDLNLPDSDGLETLIGIRNTYGDSAIVVLTGLDDDHLATQLLREGAQSYLTKDEIDPRTLERTLRFSLERHAFIKHLREADRLITQRDVRFRKLIEHSSDLILLTNERGKVIYSSPAVRRIFRYGRDEDGMNVFRVLHAEDMTRAQQWLQQALDQPGVPVPMTVRARTAEDRIIWLEGSIANLLALEGVRAIVANFKDVTERVLAMERIAFERNNQKALINSTSDMIWSVDRDLKVITANRSLRRAVKAMSGFDVEVGATIVPPIVFGSYDSTLWKGYYERCLKGETFTVEGHTLLPEPRWGEFTFNPIREGENIVGVACACHDITERVKLEQRIAFDHNNLDALINSTQDLVWSLDPELRIITANKAFLDALEGNLGIRLGPGDSVMRDDFQGAAPITRWREYYERALSGYAFRIEEHFTTPQELWIEVYFSPIQEGGEIKGVACFSRSITERKRAEEKVRNLNIELEERVVERTSELVLANENLETEMFKNQRLSELLTLRNQDLMSSITYARRIQDALFPVDLALAFFNATACFSRPRNVLSGDFLWQHETADNIFLALGDCTGHGVPGALMSMLGHSLLNQMVLDHRMTAPAPILTQMDKALEATFGQHDPSDRVHDGMDIGLFVIDKQRLELTFSGALIKCYVLRDNELLQLECSRCSIGGHMPLTQKVFSEQRLRLRKGDRLVLTSDGYQSQFGGPLSKRFNAQRFRELLLRTASNGPSVAMTLIESEFDQWKGKEDQVDDVLVVLLDV